MDDVICILDRREDSIRVRKSPAWMDSSAAVMWRESLARRAGRVAGCVNGCGVAGVEVCYPDCLVVFAVYRREVQSIRDGTRYSEWS